MNKIINTGAYPVMITPYQADGRVDWGAVKALTEWYWKKGCHGIFAACQSSEIRFLSLADRIGLARTVKDTADALARTDKSRAPMSVVASGHVSEDPDEQIHELRSVAETGVDALVLITNRSDIANTGDERWIADTAHLLENLPDDITLGTYECPLPYKRLLTPTMLRWIASTGRFGFIKDTCCDADMIRERLQILDGTGVGLFNANAQTLLQTIRDGAWGYCGVMCNFHPALYVWLWENFKQQPEKADYVHDFLSMAAFTEVLDYPCTAKYHLDRFEGVPMTTLARSADNRKMTPYHCMCIDQMKQLADRIEQELGIN